MSWCCLCDNASNLSGKTLCSLQLSHIRGALIEVGDVLVVHPLGYVSAPGKRTYWTPTHWRRRGISNRFEALGCVCQVVFAISTLNDQKVVEAHGSLGSSSTFYRDSQGALEQALPYQDRVIYAFSCHAYAALEYPPFAFQEPECT